MEVFSMSHLAKSFGNLAVLKDISMSVEKGEVVSIIGPSGSGKSTLLRCATMLEKVDAGNLAYGGIDVVRNGVYSPAATLKKARSHFGLVFQNFNLFPHYSVLKNIIDAPISVQKRPRAEARAEAMDLLTKMGLADRANAYPCQLSGGQQQRVSIARALAMHPEILFFDEPTSALDPELTQEILHVLRKLAEMHMTMVIVTHEIEFARKISDRVIFMADGVIVEEGSPDEVIGHPKLERTQTFLANFGNH